MQNFIKRYSQAEDGATAVEFALVAVAFMTLVFGIMETGRIMWVQNAIQYGIENAARYAIVNEGASDFELEEVATDSLAAMSVASAPLEMTVTTFNQNDTDFVQIDATYSYSPMVTSFLPEGFISPTLSATTITPLNFPD